MKKFNTGPGAFRALRTLLLCMLIGLLSACSAVRLTYNHGETLLYWWLDAYVDLDAGQKAGVKQDIDELFQWHRKSQLKDYAQLLAHEQQRLQGSPTPADLLADYGEVKKRMRTLLQKAEPELAALARKLRPEQIDHMEKKFAANNDTYRKKFLRGGAEKRQQVRYEKAMDQFELWFGNFSREQEQAIRKASDARPLENEIWYDERLRRQRNIVNLVRKVQREQLSQEATTALVHQLIEGSFARLENSERKPFFDAYNEASAQMVASVIKIATPVQKAHAAKRMQGWIDDFNAMAAGQR